MTALLFWIAALFENWSERAYAKAWERRFRDDPPPPPSEIVLTTLRQRANEVAESVLAKNALLEHLRRYK